MSRSHTWGGPEAYDDNAYPLPLLKYLLKQMMVQFGTPGACMALYDASIGQMRVQLHLRMRNLQTNAGESGARATRSSGRLNMYRESDFPTSSVLGRVRHTTPPLHSPQALGEIDDVPPLHGDIFAPGTTYPVGQDLIGQTWQNGDVYAMRHEDYLDLFHGDAHNNHHPSRLAIGPTPTSYLSVPIRESTLVDEVHGEKRHAAVLGVVVFYQVKPEAIIGFQARQRNEAIQFAERVALYLQNERLRQAQRRTSVYSQLLQGISTAFPTNVLLSDLVKHVHQFASNVVNISSMLLTLYDRDTERIYDVFAVQNGVSVEGLPDRPIISSLEERPMWWQIIQKEKRRLQFSPADEPQKCNEYEELLAGTWGDQHQAQSFLLLPMKMFTRVIGSLSLASMRADAYHLEEIQVLETMVQIAAVSVENAKLYERARFSAREAKKREEQARKREEMLAAMNSALQSISSVLEVTELLNNFVRSATTLVQAEVGGFFQLSPDRDDITAQAIYSPTRVMLVDDESGLPAVTPPRSKEADNTLIHMIRLPFKGTSLEQRSESEGFFYLDQSELEALTKGSQEGGALFLQTTQAQQWLFVPVAYQRELLGLFAVPAPGEKNSYEPEQVGTLLAICAQAATAIRNAQLFEQREEAYAELERMNKLKDEFLVTASHELRTPLSAVIGYAGLLKKSSARVTPQQILKYATNIAEASQQLADLVTNMTDAANIGPVNKKLDVQIGSVQVLMAAEAATATLRVNIGQTISLDIESGLWVNGDPLYVRQVIMNLLDNAAKYSPREGQIRVSAQAALLSEVVPRMSQDQMDHGKLFAQGDVPVVLVSVRDQGEGILPEDQTRIFEKFVRAPRSLTTTVRGSGLGLYICRQYIESMGGKLWLDASLPGQGSKFSFYLPRADASVSTGEPGR